MRTLIVFNPTAGHAEQLEAELEAAAQVWRQKGWTVELQPTSGPGDGCRLARQAATEGYDLVVAAGGDGTINEVVNGLAGSDSPTRYNECLGT
jgi:diacylglycerol kinase (ATP)